MDENDITEPTGVSEEETGNICGLCDSTSVICFCSECGFFLCHVCQISHKRQTKTKDHEITVSKLTINQEQTNEQNTRSTGTNETAQLGIKCDVHPTESVGMLCLKCNAIMCDICADNIHRGHISVSLEVSSQHLQKICKNTTKSYKDIKDNLQETKTKLELQTGTIKQVIDTRINNIQKWRDALIAKIRISSETAISKTKADGQELAFAFQKTTNYVGSALGICDIQIGVLTSLFNSSDVSILTQAIVNATREQKEVAQMLDQTDSIETETKVPVQDEDETPFEEIAKIIPEIFAMTFSKTKTDESKNDSNPQTTPTKRSENNDETETEVLLAANITKTYVNTKQNGAKSNDNTMKEETANTPSGCNINFPTQPNDKLISANILETYCVKSQENALQNSREDNETPNKLNLVELELEASATQENDSKTNFKSDQFNELTTAAIGTTFCIKTKTQPEPISQSADADNGITDLNPEHTTLSKTAPTLNEQSSNEQLLKASISSTCTVASKNTEGAESSESSKEGVPDADVCPGNTIVNDQLSNNIANEQPAPVHISGNGNEAPNDITNANVDPKTPKPSRAIGTPEKRNEQDGESVQCTPCTKSRAKDTDHLNVSKTESASSLDISTDASIDLPSPTCSFEGKQLAPRKYWRIEHVVSRFSNYCTYLPKKITGSTFIMEGVDRFRYTSFRTTCTIQDLPPKYIPLYKAGRNVVNVKLNHHVALAKCGLVWFFKREITQVRKYKSQHIPACLAAIGEDKIATVSLNQNKVFYYTAEDYKPKSSHILDIPTGHTITDLPCLVAKNGDLIFKTIDYKNEDFLIRFSPTGSILKHMAIDSRVFPCEWDATTFTDDDVLIGVSPTGEIHVMMPDGDFRKIGQVENVKRIWGCGVGKHHLYVSFMDKRFKHYVAQYRLV